MGCFPKRRPATNSKAGQVARRLLMDLPEEVADVVRGKSARALEDGSFRDRYALQGHSPPPTSPEYVSCLCDSENAMKNLVDILFPQNGPARCQRNPVPLQTFDGLSSNRAFVRSGADLASMALVATRAGRVGSRAFRKSDGAGGLETSKRN